MTVSSGGTINYQKLMIEQVATTSKYTHSKTGNNLQNLGSLKLEINYLSLSISNASQSLNLVYDKAIAAINIELEGTHGANSTEEAYTQGIDFNPEATAQRIVNFATSFFDIYSAKNEELSAPEALNSYMDIIGGAIDKGFSEAKDILNSLNIFSGEIKENVDSTYDIIQEKLALYKEGFYF